MTAESPVGQGDEGAGRVQDRAAHDRAPGSGLVHGDDGRGQTGAGGLLDGRDLRLGQIEGAPLHRRAGERPLEGLRFGEEDLGADGRRRAEDETQDETDGGARRVTHG